MKPVMKWLVLPLILVSVALVATLVLMVDDEPMLRHSADLTPERIQRGKRVFEANDPRRLRSGTIAKVQLAQDDLDLALNYVANQYLDGSEALEIENGRAVIQATLKLPVNPLGRYLNLKIALEQTDRLPRIENMTLGKIWIPGFIAEWLAEGCISASEAFSEIRTARDMIRSVRFDRRSMTVTYRWRRDLPGKLSAAWWSEEDLQRLAAYQSRLAEIANRDKNPLKLTALTTPLFQLAAQRSLNGDAVAENRALILVLAFYVNQKALTKILPPSQSWPHAIWRRVILNERDDFTKHYLVSAMLAAYAGTPLSHALGLYKEIEDARGGSGFSFNDIAADNAGTRMGKLATASETRARKIQKLMAKAQESDIMPVTADLPEFLRETEFNRRFGGLQGAKYRELMDEIDRRVAELPINRD